MRRPTRTFAGFGLALLAFSAGCHNVRDEVPPHQRFRNDGKPDSPVEFSTAPHEKSATSNGLIGGAQPNAAPGGNLTNPAPGGNVTNSVASPGNAYVGMNSEQKFGGPGTSGLGKPPALMEPPALMDPPAAPASTYPPRPASRSEAPSLIPGQPSDAPSPL